jgi:hypothetical protein
MYNIPSGEYNFVSKNISSVLKSPMAVAPAVTPLDTTLFIPGEVTVRIRQFNKGAQIRYTLDGSDPDENSKLYEKPFKIRESTVIKARVFKKGSEPSTVVKRTIVFVDKEKNRVNYNFYEGVWSDVPDFKRLKPQRKGKAYNLSIEDIANLPDNFGLMMTSDLELQQSGSYTF